MRKEPGCGRPATRPGRGPKAHDRAAAWTAAPRLPPSLPTCESSPRSEVVAAELKGHTGSCEFVKVNLRRNRTQSEPSRVSGRVIRANNPAAHAARLARNVPTTAAVYATLPSDRRGLPTPAIRR